MVQTTMNDPLMDGQTQSVLVDIGLVKGFYVGIYLKWQRITSASYLTLESDFLLDICLTFSVEVTTH